MAALAMKRLLVFCLLFVCVPAWSQAMIHPNSIGSIELFIQADSLNADYDDDESLVASPAFEDWSGNAHEFNGVSGGGSLIFKETQSDLNNRSYIHFGGTSNGSVIQSSEAAATWNFLHDNDFTIIMLIRSTLDSTTIQSLLATNIGATTNTGNELYIRGDLGDIYRNVVYRASSGTTVYVLDSNITQHLNEWVTIAVVFDDSTAGDDAAIYFDNTVDATTDLVGSVSATNAAHTINFGRRPSIVGANWTFRGDIALVALYSDNLTTGELAGIHAWINCEYFADCGSGWNVRRRGLQR